MMKPAQFIVGRVHVIPYVPAKNRLVFADARTDYDELMRWRKKLPWDLQDTRWRYDKLPRPHSIRKLYRLIAFTKLWRQPPAKKLHTLLCDMVRDRLFEKQGDLLDSVPQYYQACVAFTGFVLGLYYALGIKPSALIAFTADGAPLTFSNGYDLASLNTPRGP